MRRVRDATHFITRKIERLPKQQSRRRYAANGFALIALRLSQLSEGKRDYEGVRETSHELAIRSFGISHNPTRTQLFP
jgi:hypothetical protein